MLLIVLFQSIVELGGIIYWDSISKTGFASFEGKTGMIIRSHYKIF
jgi:hypothetical protein